MNDSDISKIRHQLSELANRYSDLLDELKDIKDTTEMICDDMSSVVDDLYDELVFLDDPFTDSVAPTAGELFPFPVKDYAAESEA